MVGPLAVLLGCAPEVLDVRATADASGFTATANLPIERLEIRDGSGQLWAARQVDPPSTVTSALAPHAAGNWEILAFAGGQSAVHRVWVSDPGPFGVRVEAPLGQDALPDGAPIDVPEGAALTVGVVVQAHQDGPIRWSTDDGQGSFTLVAGERAVIPVPLQTVARTLVLEGGGQRRELALVPSPVAADALRRSLRVGQPALPALADGRVDPTVPAGRITLPAPWWDATLDRLGLGFRPRDDLAPRTHVSVAVENVGERSLNLVISARVSDAHGQTHPAFRPRLRDADDLEVVRRLIRVDPGRTAAVALPVYVDRALLVGTESNRVEVEVRALGLEAPLARVERVFVLDRGTPWASAAFTLALIAMVAGWSGIARGLPRWLAWPLRDLTTVAVFGSLSFTIGVASQLLGLGVASLLGPFAPFVFGVVDDAVRMCLLGTLLVLVPRVGAFSLATLIGWLMRAIALGAVHPVDALYLGGAVFWTESLLFLAGVTRGAGVGTGPFVVRWLRLTIGLGLSNAVAVGVALAVSVVVYRLHYAGWYVIALVGGPGLLYAAVGCALAVPFADAVRRAA